jgi:Protein of unknown function (DUF2569)
VTQDPIIAKSIQPKYQGVGGWLMFLCIILTILSPLKSAHNLITGFQEILPLRNEFPGLMLVAVVDTILGLGLVAFGFYAGMKLWQKMSGAVRAAKTYFLIFLAYSVVAAFLPFMAGLPEESNKIMAEEMPKAIVSSLIYFCIWFAYLSVSKRVRATYPDARYTANETEPPYPTQPHSEDHP